jgi:type IV pilus assembly protein PilO
MKFFEQLRALDPNDVGRWPFLFRAILVGIIFLFVAGGGTWYFVMRDGIPALERVQREEQDLRGTLESKQRLAANLDAYRQQLAEVERSFGTMLRQLPGRTEIPNLLVDISQTGLAAGLDERLFQPMNEIPQESYAELPIKIQLAGTYHELGNFVSGVAALPRIVTLHDVQLQPDPDGVVGDLIMDVTAKTYRYLDDDVEAN